MRHLLLIAILFATLSSAPAQQKAVEFTSFQLSDTVYMLSGRGGNVGISTGEDGVYIIDDQVKPVTDGLVEAIMRSTKSAISCTTRGRPGPFLA